MPPGASLAPLFVCLFVCVSACQQSGGDPEDLVIQANSVCLNMPQPLQKYIPVFVVFCVYCRFLDIFIRTDVCPELVYIIDVHLSEIR